MRDRFDAVDQAEADKGIHEAQDAYVAGEIEADELERRIGKRDDEILFGDEWGALSHAKEDLRAVDRFERMVNWAIERAMQVNEKRLKPPRSDEELIVRAKRFHARKHQRKGWQRPESVHTSTHKATIRLAA